MWSGMTTETFICGAFTRKSATSASVKPFTANFAADWAVCGTLGPSEAQKPFMLLVLTICAPSAKQLQERAGV
jgi:hypothetical protein